MTAPRWTAVRVENMADREAIVAALFASGAEGVQELDDAVVAHIADADTNRIAGALARAEPAARVTFTATPDTDWSSAWRARVSAHRVGMLVVTPPWLASQYLERERVIIEPAMAFGTGEHETTRGVMRLMQAVIRSGDVVADLGSGSAVLAIAAAKLGAARVVGIEMDPEAIGNAEENIARNGVGDRCTVIEGDAGTLLPLIAPVNLVLANIVAGVLRNLLPVIGAALTPDGAAILSGILLDERAEMERAIQDAGWRVTNDSPEGIWWSVTIVRG